MGGRNEQADLISRNNNHSNACLVHAVKVKRINSQVTSNGYNIDDLKPGTIAVNNLNANADTCCLVSNFTVLQMTSRNSNIYPYYPS